MSIPWDSLKLRLAITVALLRSRMPSSHGRRSCAPCSTACCGVGRRAARGDGGQIAEAIRAEVQATVEVEGAPQGVTASIGVVETAGARATLAGVMESADRACYAAKRAGRNAVREASDEPPLIAAGP